MLKRITLQNKADAREIIEALFKDQGADCVATWQGMIDAGASNPEVYAYAIDCMSNATQAALDALSNLRCFSILANRDMTPEARYNDD